MTPFSVHTREEFPYIKPKISKTISKTSFQHATNSWQTSEPALSSPRDPGALFFPGTKEVFLASMTSWASPGTTQRIVRFRSGQHWATAAMAWVIGTHLRDGCKWIVSSHGGTPKSSQSWMTILVLKPVVTWGSPTLKKKTYERENTFNLRSAAVQLLTQKGCSRKLSLGAVGTCLSLVGYLWIIPKQWRATREIDKTWQDYITTNPRFPEQLG